MVNVNLYKIGGTQVTDAGLKELSAFRNLERLNIGFSRVTDSGLKEFEWFTLAITVTPTPPPLKEEPTEENATANPAAKTNRSS